MKHQIIIATMNSGNVQRISRHKITTPRGATRLVSNNSQIWMTSDTALGLGAFIETFWGTLPNGTEIKIKSQQVMDAA